MARLPSAGRSTAIIVAVILAALSVFFIWRYVDGLEDEVREDNEFVEVFVAEQTIPAGTGAGAAATAIARSEIPRESRPPGAITSLEEISGLVAVTDILAGEFIQLQRFGTEAQSTVDFEIPDGLMAMSLEVEIPPGVAGFVKPGDEISVLTHVEVPEPAAPIIGPDGTLIQPETDEDGPIATRSQFVVQKVQVLAVGRRVIVTNEEGQETDDVRQTESILATVAVSDQQAEKLLFALQEGTLYFTLLSEDYDPELTPGRTFDDLFNPIQN